MTGPTHVWPAMTGSFESKLPLRTSVVLRHHAEGKTLPRREQWARQG
jgi:hypothetical protein